MANPPAYWDYLNLDTLLSLQGGLEKDEEQISADELHFIVVHQVYELWFKLIIRSVRLARDHLAQPVVDEEIVPHVAHHLGRVNTILTLMTQQWKVMETLQPQDFLEFRDKLVPASGFQAFQMRVLEILMGLDDSQRVRLGKVEPISHIQKMGRGSPAGEMAIAAMAQAKSEMSIKEALLGWLYRTPIHGSQPGDEADEQVVDTFIHDYLDALGEHYGVQLPRFLEVLGGTNEEHLRAKFADSKSAARAFLLADDVDESDRVRVKRCRAAVLFIESYRSVPLLAWPRLLLDVVVELEEQMVHFRHSHARMVERVIGRRVGTGGSEGVAYLDKTTHYRVFSDLWAVRTLLLPRDRVPPLKQPGFYGFAK